MHLFFAVLLALTQQWLVVSDLHVQPFDNSPQPSSYESDTNWALLDSTVEQMRRTEPNPQVVIIGGDFLAHHFADAVHAGQPNASTTAVAEQVMKRIERSFAKAFPHAQFVITLGNNDDPCGDYTTAPNTPYLAALARIWEPLVNRNGAAPHFLRDFSHAGYYAAKLPIAGLRAVVPNSVYWSIVYRPCGHVSGNPAGDQLAFVSRALRDANRHSIVVMHIPPGVDENSTLLTHRFIVVPFLRGSIQTQLEHILSTDKKRVRFLLAGHIHQLGFRIIGGVPVLVAPAVSPVYSANPSFLRVQMGGDGTLLNYQLFAYSEYEEQWSQVFDFDRAFGVGAFTADALHTVHDRIAGDEQTRQVWSAAVVAGSPSRRVDSGNWRAFWCAQTTTGADYAACAGAQRRVAAVPIAGAILAGIVLLGLVALVLRLATQRSRA